MGEETGIGIANGEIRGDEIISCLSFERDPHQPWPPDPLLPWPPEWILVDPKSPEGDCTIYSTAWINSKLIPQITLQDWYDRIMECAINRGYYPLDPDGGADVFKILECKNEVALSLGYVETFAWTPTKKLQPSWYNSFSTAYSPISCPPFSLGEQILLRMTDPYEGGHIVSCTILECPLYPGSSRLLCDDRIRDGVSGFITPSQNELVVNREGIIEESDYWPELVGWTVQSVFSPTVTPI